MRTTSVILVALLVAPLLLLAGHGAIPPPAPVSASSDPQHVSGRSGPQLGWLDPVVLSENAALGDLQVLARPAGDFFLTGTVNGTNVTVAGLNATSDSYARPFVARLNESGHGQWIQVFHRDLDDVEFALATTGGLLALGEVNAIGGNVTLNGHTHESCYPDLFAAGIDENGTWQWQTIIDQHGCQKARWWRLNAAADGGARVAFTLRDNVTINNVTTQSTHPTGWDTMIVALGASGETVWSVHSAGTLTSSFQVDLATDTASNASYLCGAFRHTPSLGSTQLDGDSVPEAFMARISPSGSWSWVTQSVNDGYASGFTDCDVTEDGRLIGWLGSSLGTTVLQSTDATTISAYRATMLVDTTAQGVFTQVRAMPSHMAALAANGTSGVWLAGQYRWPSEMGWGADLPANWGSQSSPEAYIIHGLDNRTWDDAHTIHGTGYETIHDLATMHHGLVVVLTSTSPLIRTGPIDTTLNPLNQAAVLLLLGPDADGDDWADAIDDFPADPTQWKDSDGDGLGDNYDPATWKGVRPAGLPGSRVTGATTPDVCPLEAGNSTLDRLGCPDTDGDGYSDGNDIYANDPTQWYDTDRDGYGDQLSGTDPDHCPFIPGASHEDRSGCTDSDGDGWSDPDALWTPAHGADAFPTDGTQHVDVDGDSWGDNPNGTLADACVGVQGFSWRDRGGCPDADGDGVSDPDGSWTAADGADLWPNDGTQWADRDGDGYGDNWGDATQSTWRLPGGIGEFVIGATLEDRCPSTSGTSWRDVYGCPDADGDGWSDGYDTFDHDATQTYDRDGDGWGDNASGTDPDACPDVAGTSTEDRLGCLDSDGDGWSDPEPAWPWSRGADLLPLDPTQHVDRDGDGHGDDPNGTRADACPDVAGASHLDRFGCADSDGDGVSDPTANWTFAAGADRFPADRTQQRDSDGDGFGDDPNGTHGDQCPDEAGTTRFGRLLGCLDTDGDGWSDEEDAFPWAATQWSDRDGDGLGDEPSGEFVDHCPAVAGSAAATEPGCPEDLATDRGEPTPEEGADRDAAGEAGRAPPSTMLLLLLAVADVAIIVAGAVVVLRRRG